MEAQYRRVLEECEAAYANEGAALLPQHFTLFDATPAGRAIVTAAMGSLSHGTYIPGEKSIDDIDILVVALPPAPYVIGLRRFETHVMLEGRWDVNVHSLQKFMRLLLKSNPNVVGLLWLPGECYFSKSAAFELLTESRDLFLSRRIFSSFVGYAVDQFRRMERFHFEGYMGAKRKALVTEFGYDTKNAAHAIRLLRMGTEALATGRFNVFREHDGLEILEIRTGQWPLELVREEFELRLRRAEQAHANSTLPDEIPHDKAEALLLRIVGEALCAELSGSTN